MKFSTPWFSRSLLLKLEMQKYRKNFGLVKLQNFYGNVTSFFSTHFVLKLLRKFFEWFVVEIGETYLLLGCKNNIHAFRSQIKFLEWNFGNIIKKKNVSFSLAIF